MPIARVVLALSLLLAAARAGAGHVIEMTDGDGHAMTLRIEGKRWRIDSAARKDGHASIVIADGEARTLIIADPGTKTYRSIDQEQVEGQMAQAQAKMNEALARMPPERRKQMEEMMKSRGGAAGGPRPRPIAFKKTGRTGTAAGHRCTFYEESREGEPGFAEVCIAGFGELDLRKEDFKALMEFRGLPGDRAQSPASAWTDAPGFPLVTENRKPDGTLRETMRVTSIARKPIPAELFRPPAGFAAKKLSE